MITGDLFGNTPSSVVERSAEFSENGRFRWSLTRRIGDGPLALMIGHNPSKAGHDRDDPTSLWWIKFCRHHGYGGYIAANLYPLVATAAEECRCWAEWQHRAGGPDWYARDAIQENLYRLGNLALRADAVFACWGAMAEDHGWIDQVVEEIHNHHAGPILCFGFSKSGAPKHPMARGKHRMDPATRPLVWRER